MVRRLQSYRVLRICYYVFLSFADLASLFISLFQRTYFCVLKRNNVIRLLLSQGRTQSKEFSKKAVHPGFPGPVAERALKIAMIVTETLIRKDFALDPDENNLKKAAFHMVSWTCCSRRNFENSVSKRLRIKNLPR